MAYLNQTQISNTDYDLQDKRIPDFAAGDAGKVLKVKSDGTIEAGQAPTSDSWRNIKVNNTEILGTGTSTGALNLKSGSNISVSNSGGDVTINNTLDISGKENISNKSNSYTASSTTTYPNTKALVDGLATKSDIYIQNTEPADAKAGDIWVDPEAVTGGRGNMKTYVTSTAPTDAQEGDIWVNPSRSSISSSDLLWTNTSPTSEFAAQIINLDLSNYIMSAVELREYTGNSGGQVKIFSVGSYNYVTLFDYNTTDKFGRSIEVRSSYVSFGAGWKNNNSNNTALIPVKIYGIR